MDGCSRLYTLSSPGAPALELHPSRVVRFLGNPLPDPNAVGTPWSDSVLQSLYDAVHAAALSLAGATSLLHEAKVDVVTVPNLSEHLSSAETTAQLSARFASAAAMTSMNNLASARRRRELVAAGGRLRGPARDGAHVPPGRGGGGRHPGDAAARAVAGRDVVHGRERRSQ